ncbi:MULTISPECIES: ABC transporter permease [Pseudonocardia]|uniref:Oligopeptide transport system permease protein OppC n=2 Tax=Pseudonocardia TaxID=1847 RepID=A0A1Y2N4N4_PSEAH|nr:MULTISPECIES: ABC transporter permease [Pseudonocardia]OSY42416.1 Oligopeptide transport system permease protein OppC [Pseudonocardia autotrophica]TDN75936.1 peptide/nickel transport system permease protein [Pseudonocardia autotrophica]BBF99908.1 ABC transporter permease [Pseudonocardia autotrophica]GEC24967.1 ABC transporter permease [Pseudonocardia saturnea]
MPDATGTKPDAVTGGTDHEFTVAERSQAQLVLRRFVRHRAAMVSLIVLGVVVLLAYIGGWLWRYDVGEITSANSQPPSLQHPFGTDSVGKDQFAQVLGGTRISLQVSILVAFVSTLVGTLWGSVAGYFGGWVDTLMMRIADLILTLPLLAVAAMLAHNFGGTWYLIAMVIAGLYWAYVSRVARGVVLSLREKEFVEAARALGASDTRIILRHLVPNALGSILVNLTILVALAILLETALSYLGFGVQTPDTSLGLLVSEAQTALTTRPWLFYFPGLFIIVIALTINFIGDGLRDAFDPQQTKVRQ